MGLSEAGKGQKGLKWQVSAASCSLPRWRAPRAGEHPLRHVAELPSRSGRPHGWPEWAEPDVVRAFTDRGISLAVVTPGAGRGLGSRRTSCGGQHRHSVGKVSGLSTSCPQRASNGTSGPGAVPVAHEGARSRPIARRARVDGGHSAAGRCRAHGLRRRQSRRSAPLRARAVALAVFQSRHDPPVDPAQPCALGVSCCAVFGS